MSLRRQKSPVETIVVASWQTWWAWPTRRSLRLRFRTWSGVIIFWVSRQLLSVGWVDLSSVFGGYLYVVRRWKFRTVRVVWRLWLRRRAHVGIRIVAGRTLDPILYVWEAPCVLYAMTVTGNFGIMHRPCFSGYPFQGMYLLNTSLFHMHERQVNNNTGLTCHLVVARVWSQVNPVLS